MFTSLAFAPELIIFPDKDSLSRDAAYRLSVLAANAARARGRFTMALAGGSTPETLYRLLVQPPFETAFPWQETHLFFGDERCVPPDAPESNYRMATEALQLPGGRRLGGIYRMPTDHAHHPIDAEAYETQLKDFFGLEAGELPRFDVVLLGMGPDGHCASLFPNQPALQITDRLVVATEAGLKPFVSRLTLTLPVLNNAAHVFFLVAGTDKAETLARVLHEPTGGELLPVQRIAPTNGTLTWLVDRAALSRVR